MTASYQRTNLGKSDGDFIKPRAIVRKLLELEQVEDFAVRDVDLGSGILSCVLTFPEKLFYQVLSEESGFPVENDGELLELLESLSAAKRVLSVVSIRRAFRKPSAKLSVTSSVSA